MHKAKFWHFIDDGRIQCDVCPRACRLKDGQRGLCFVRARQGDDIILTCYGKTSGLCIDPIEKKPLYHFLPGTPILSFGTAGCNLTCRYCQNWDISKTREIDTFSQDASPEFIARAAKDNGCSSVAFTYNDPIVFMEYAIDTAQACHELGIKTVAVTNGYMCPEARAEFYRYMDAANVDLKGFSERFYHDLCAARLEPVLDSLIYLVKEAKTWVEITTLLIPGQNDSDKELEELTAWVYENLGAEVPLHFSAFHPAYKMMDTPPTPFRTLEKAREKAITRGLKNVYTGNVRDRTGSTTWCPGCSRPLIVRDGFEILSCHVSSDGKCPSCGEVCAGVFAERAGSWNGRREAL